MIILIDFSKPESKRILLKLGLSESKIEELVTRQKNGEKIPKFIKITNSEGKGKLVSIPDSSEEIEEKRNLHKEHLIKNRIRKDEMARKKDIKIMEIIRKREKKI